MYEDYERIPKSFIPIGSFIHKILVLFEHCYWLKIYDGYRKRHHISPSFTFRGNNILIIREGTKHSFRAGNLSYIRGDSRINITGGSVHIGSGCNIAQRLNIHTSGTDTEDVLKGESSENWLKESRGDVIIGDNVWIGDDVTIISPVSIGNNSVIGSGSVVTKDVPSNCVVAGNPARIVKQ